MDGKSERVSLRLWEKGLKHKKEKKHREEKQELHEDFHSPIFYIINFILLKLKNDALLSKYQFLETTMNM